MTAAVLGTLATLAGLAVLGWSLVPSTRRRPMVGAAPPGGTRAGTASPWGMHVLPAGARLSLPPPARLAAAALAAVVTGLVTGWPVGACLGGAAALGVPALWGRTGSSRATVRVEAVAAWTEMLRDTLHASVGLVQAIVATAPVAPGEIAVEVAALAERLSSGVPPAPALRAFADELGDGSADVVVCALLLAAGARAQRLADLLGALADATRQDVAARLRIDAARVSARSGVRIIVVFSVAFVAALAVLAHSYLAPFGTPAGQLILLLVGICDTGAIMLLARMTRPPQVPRLLGALGPASGPVPTAGVPGAGIGGPERGVGGRLAGGRARAAGGRSPLRQVLP